VKLLIGNKNYSSWSLRVWIALKVKEFDFVTDLRPFASASDFQDFFEFSPTGKVPVLQHKGRTIWESLAILEYLAEQFPAAMLWPVDVDQRTEARCISHEMHAGFSALRTCCPMNMRRPPSAIVVSSVVEKDVSRIETIWQGCLEAYGGPFLFGEFSIADAMYAPVVNRLQIYQLSDTEAVQRYTAAMTELPAWRDWVADSRAETWVVDMDEV